MTQVQTESVLVVPTDLFHRLGHFQGFTDQVDLYLGELFLPENTSYRPRHEVEEDPSFKQLIPYVIFRHRDAQGRMWVFQYTRGKGQGEGRLHSKKSIGIGGHISADDRLADANGALGTAAYHEGMRRELAEEVKIDSPYTERCAGLINDDLSDVGRVHLGVVHIFDLQRPQVEAMEADIVEANFRLLDEILSEVDAFETWSQICLKSLFAD